MTKNNNLKLDNVPIIVYQLCEGMRDGFDKGVPLKFKDWDPNQTKLN